MFGETNESLTIDYISFARTTHNILAVVRDERFHGIIYDRNMCPGRLLGCLGIVFMIYDKMSPVKTT
jgi:hypothetical protein